MPAINDRDDVLALSLVVLMWVFVIFLLVGTLAFIFGNDDENDGLNTGIRVPKGQ